MFIVGPQKSGKTSLMNKVFGGKNFGTVFSNTRELDCKIIGDWCVVDFPAINDIHVRHNLVQRFLVPSADGTQQQ